MKKLNARNSQNDFQIEAMMSKAMCAYANALNARNERLRLYGKHTKSAYERSHTLELCETACMSEYEATVRCIDMFVRESVPEICVAVIESCKEEFGIK